MISLPKVSASNRVYGKIFSADSEPSRLTSSRLNRVVLVCHLSVGRRSRRGAFSCAELVVGHVTNIHPIESWHPVRAHDDEIRFALRRQVINLFGDCADR